MQCGSTVNLSCTNGLCCSSAGYCGSTDAYCGYGCQGGYGYCDSIPTTSPALKPSFAPTRKIPGSCGPNVGPCQSGLCCSQWNYCGTTDLYCGVGCQSAYGICGQVPTEMPALYPKTGVPTYTHKPVTHNPSVTRNPSFAPFVVTHEPTRNPSHFPTNYPTATPTARPTSHPTAYPTSRPTSHPTARPTSHPTSRPSKHPTPNPTYSPSVLPTQATPVSSPSNSPVAVITSKPTSAPTPKPSTRVPTPKPSPKPTLLPTNKPSFKPTVIPTQKPSFKPSVKPTSKSAKPTPKPSRKPTRHHCHEGTANWVLWKLFPECCENEPNYNPSYPTEACDTIHDVCNHWGYLTGLGQRDMDFAKK